MNANSTLAIFAIYSLFLACGLFLAVFIVQKYLVKIPAVKRPLITGAAIGASVNFIFWANWYAIPRDSWWFPVVARLTLVPGAPGAFIPELWGEKMLLHHSHFTASDSFWQWTLLTVLNVGFWSAFFATVTVLARR